MAIRALALLALAAASVCGQNLGSIEFPNGGSAAAQEPFLRGVLLMHNFEYDDAAGAFRQAQSADPGFALAYWGEAMTHYRPVWDRENLEKGRAALGKGAKAKLATDRESGYFGAATALFGEGDRQERWQAYSDAMEALARQYPDDREAASLFAVSLYGTTGGQRDHRTYMRIASIAERVYLENPDHPGALHYLIHAFDDPIHAPLGLRYARRYADVASAAPHAQHMPTHIFLALGMWDECISSNIDSWESSEARVKRLGLGTDDRGYHALWWMQYGYLQLGQFEQALEKLAIIEADAAESGSVHARNHHAYLRSHYLVETRRWDAELRPVDDDGLADRAWGSNALAEGMRAIGNRDLDKARQWLTRLEERAAADGDDESSLPIAALELEGLLMVAAGNPDGGIQALRKAVEMEAGTPFGYGPPFPVKPAAEALAEALAGQGLYMEAVAAFETSLGRTPQRALSMMGLQAAAEKAGQAEKADRVRSDLSRYRQNAAR